MEILALSVAILLYRSYRGIVPISPHQGEGEVPVQVSRPKPPSPAQTVEVKVTPEEDEKKERLAQGMKLLLAARDRVLTLTEQRASAFDFSRAHTSCSPHVSDRS